MRCSMGYAHEPQGHSVVGDAVRSDEANGSSVFSNQVCCQALNECISSVETSCRFGLHSPELICRQVLNECISFLNSLCRPGLHSHESACAVKEAGGAHTTWCLLGPCLENVHMASPSPFADLVAWYPLVFLWQSAFHACLQFTVHPDRTGAGIS